jgi:sucrose-6-phosphate hydrolase SacC (GH32 family)
MPLAATGTREGLDVAAGAFASAFGPDTTSALVVAPDDPGPGAWAGGPSAVLHEGVYYLAYRLRRPVGHGRGYANVIARSEDGLRFRTIAVLHKDTFESDSLERPALVRTEDGRWRVYVSAATPGTKHWRVDLLEADSPEGLGSAPQRTVLPGSAELAVKDPVVVERHGSWHLWASRHPLDDPDQTDRMTTDYATSDDGVEWTWRGTALAGRPGQWDARGVRVAAVLLDRPTPLAFYDGRATAEENWEERTGLARVDELGTFAALGDRPIGSSPTTGTGLRYVSAVDLPDGGTRLYYEVTRPDGAHELRTTLVDHDG